MNKHTYSVLYPLYRLKEYPDFKMTGDTIEANGQVFNYSCLCLEEAFVQAYLYIQANALAKELVKKAKVVI